MEELRLVASAGEHFFPRFTGLSAEYTEEQEYEESLKGVEEHKEDLEEQVHSCDSYSESPKQPSESKQKHYTSNTNRQTDSCFLVHALLLTFHATLCVAHKYHNHPDEDDDIENEECKNWSKESSKEGTRMVEEAAVQRMNIILSSGFMYVQGYSQLVSIDNNVLLWPCSEVNNQRNDDRNYRDCCKDK